MISISRFLSPSQVLSPRRILTGLLLVFVTLGLAAAAEVEPPWTWALAALLMAVVGVGVTLLASEHLAERLPTVGLLPALTVFVTLTLVSQPWISEPAARLAAAALGGLLLAGTMLARSLEEDHRYYYLAQRAVLLLNYLLAFGMYTIIYTTKVRSFFTATTITLMTVLVVFEMFYTPKRDLHLTGLYVATAGLILGQVTWVLNYWVIGGLTGGAFLLLVLYATTGIIRAYLTGILTPRLALEYAVVMLAGFLAVAVLVSTQSTI